MIELDKRLRRCGTRTAAAVVTAVLLAAGAGSAAAAFDREEAVEAENAGDWGRAIEEWREGVEADPGDRALWSSYLRAVETRGDHDLLDREAGRALGRFPGWDAAAIHRARALEARGRGGDAVTLLQGLSGRSLEATGELARLLDGRGRRDEAGELYSTIMRAYDPSRSYTPRELLTFGLTARARGDYHGAARVLELSFSDSLDFLPGRLALADLFHDKHQGQLAASELNDARRLAPHHPDVVLAHAELSLRSRQLSQAELVARSVFRLRPDDAASHRVLAHLDLIAERTQDVRERMSGVLERNPEDRRALDLVTLSRYFDGDSTAYRSGVREMLERDPADADLFLTAGEILELLLRNEEAIAMYRRVVEADSTNAPALAAIGHLAMREGHEEEARGWLERAFELDPFNLRAYNQLELLDKMDTFVVHDGDGFRLRYSAEDDSAVVELFAERLRRIHEDLTALHGWTPPQPTTVEIFPSHEWFSARVTGLAWLEGIPGVCFGDVVAMDSPRTLSGHANWEQILRHEFGHVLALGMTDRQVPFWFTEGLSVFLETHPRGRSWDAGLVAAWWDGELVAVDSLTIAFTRPKARFQRLLAYHEAGLIIGDIVDRHGWEVIPKMLAAFGEGDDFDAAVARVLGEDPEAFKTAALAMVTERARSLAVWPDVHPDRLEGLRKRVEEDPADRTARERLTLCLYQLGAHEEAKTSAVRLLEMDPENPRGHGILGLSEKALEQPEAALAALRRAFDRGSRDVPVHLGLAELLMAEADTAGTIAAYEAALDTYPRATGALASLASLLLARGDSLAARDSFLRLVAIDDTAGDAAIELMRLDLASGDGEGALAAADFALGVLPLEATVVALRGQALLLEDRDDDAYEHFRRASRISIRNVESMVGLALYHFDREDFEEAAYFARLAVKYEPDHPVARSVLRRAEESAW
jgi:tetratricopeptide (TPR) repeat protein